jgi:hypothetical protein
MAISQSSRFLFWPQGHPSHSGQLKTTRHFQTTYFQPIYFQPAHFQQAQPPPILKLPASRSLRPFLAIFAVKKHYRKERQGCAQSTRSKSCDSSKCVLLAFASFAAFLRDLCGENAFKHAEISQSAQSKPSDTKGIQIPVAACSRNTF